MLLIHTVDRTVPAPWSRLFEATAPLQTTRQHVHLQPHIHEPDRARQVFTVNLFPCSLPTALAICVLTTLRDLQRAAGEESRLAPLAVMAADVVRHQRPSCKSAWSVFTR